MKNYLAQELYGIRFDWGATGAKAQASDAACIVIVDVLSFCTSVSVAVQAGTRVFPYPRHDASAAEFARRHGAVLAATKREGTADAPWTLSPAALRRAPAVPALVLPSPNGSAIAAAAGAAAEGAPGGAGSGAARKTPVVAAACLRNAAAAGRWLAGRGLGTPGRPAAVIAAGERWPDGGLRPALEDLLGAGAVIAAALARGAGPPGPEAAAAVAAFRGTTDVPAALAGSVSGRELAGRGFAEDVAIAAEAGSCPAVPVLERGAFTAAS